MWISIEGGCEVVKSSDSFSRRGSIDVVLPLVAPPGPPLPALVPGDMRSASALRLDAPAAARRCSSDDAFDDPRGRQARGRWAAPIVTGGVLKLHRRFDSRSSGTHWPEHRQSDGLIADERIFVIGVALDGADLAPKALGPPALLCRRPALVCLAPPRLRQNDATRRSLTNTRARPAGGTAGRWQHGASSERCHNTHLLEQLEPHY